MATHRHGSGVLTVHKYPFTLQRDVVLDLPEGAKPLHVAVQRGVPCLWALVDPQAPLVPTRFRAVVTGASLTDDVLEYVDTVMTDGGAFVFHVFQVFERGGG